MDPAKTDISNKRILLVEDDDLIREMYKTHLSEAKFNVDAVGNGKQARAILATEHFDLILLDIMLPDSNGLEILKEINENSKTKDMPVVLLTNLGQEAVINEAYKLGAKGYMLKIAYNPDQMVEEVKKFLTND